MARWRYWAQNARTRQFVHTDLPLDVDTMTWTLSGAGQLTAKCDPDTGLLRDENGDLILVPWGTLLYAESDGVIRWGGIVVSSAIEGQAWRIEAAGFATYPHKLTVKGYRSYANVDPTVPFKDIWTDVQTEHGGLSDLDVLVVAEPSAAKIGYSGTVGDGDQPISPDQVSPERWAELIREDGWTVGTQTGAALLYPPARKLRSVVGDVEFQRLIDEDRWRPEEKPDGAPSDWKPSYVDPPLQQVEAAPYVLAAYEAPNAGQKLDDLTTSTPFDWLERHWWVPEGSQVDAEAIDPDLAAWLQSRGWYGLPDDGAEILYRPAGFPDRAVAHVVHVYWPRVGSRRDDLAFVQPDNITDPVTPEYDGDEYANAILGIGAGQGPTTLQVAVQEDDGRLYVESVYTDKAIADYAVMDAQTRDELAWRQGVFEVSGITVREHPNAPIGSWQLGDDIMVRAVVPWYGDVNMWCRVTGEERVDDQTSKLSLVRSDAFRYGGR